MIGDAATVLSVDGPLGSGKTPLCDRIVEELSRRGLTTTKTTALSETELGNFVRQAQFKYSGRTLACMAAADRHLQLENVVQPAIESGRPVVIDRYVPTAIALDAYASELPPVEILNLYPGCPVPKLSVLAIADVAYRRDRLKDKGLLEKYDAWHLTIEQEEDCYRSAADYLTTQGWNFKIVDTPIEQFSQSDVSNLVDELLLS